MSKKKQKQEKEKKTAAGQAVTPAGNGGVSGVREDALADEMLLVRRSGEIPEVAFHGSLYYLAEDPEGPGIEVSHQERLLLVQQALARYREIMLRDLDPENRDKTLFRGLARCVVNWERCRNFCQKEGLDNRRHNSEVAKAFVAFLEQECQEVKAGLRTTSVNCSAVTLLAFAKALGVATADLPGGLAGSLSWR